jgi:inner membrane transporter RhtA
VVIATRQRHAAEGAAFVLASAVLIQYAATLAVGAFGRISPSATSGWRFLLGAVVLVAIARPKWRTYTRAQWTSAIALGLATAAMNQSFYQAIQRIPLGSAVAIEFLGPVLVAALGGRSWRHGVAVLGAAAGVVLLTRPGSGITLTGALFAGVAGAGWAAYTFASHHVGRNTNRFDGLATAMVIATFVTLAPTIGAASRVTHSPGLLGRLAVMAGLAIVLGFMCDLQALRRLRPAVVGVLLALDPAVAFVVGALVLHQHVTIDDLGGLVLVVGAGVAVTIDAARRADEPAVEVRL